MSADSKVFFFSAGGPAGVRTLDAFRAQPFSMRDLRPFGSIFKDVKASASQEIRVWAFPDSRLNRRRWSRLRQGDMGFGYAAGVYRVASTLRGTGYSRELGRQLFGQD